MKQTIDRLERWHINPRQWVCTRYAEDNLECTLHVLSPDTVRDAEIMAALTSKAGLPYVAKLTALLMEQ